MTVSKNKSESRGFSVKEIRKYIEKERKKDRLRKKKYSPEKYAAYRKRKRKKTIKAGLILLAALAILVLLLIVIVKLFTFAGGMIFGKDKSEKQSSVLEVTATPIPEKSVTLGSTGCILLHDAVLEAYKQSNGTFDFSECFDYIRPYYSAVDFMTCEYEGTNGGEELGYSGYPSFNSPDQIIEDMAGSGVDMVLLASNHVYDCLSEAFHRTMDTYDALNVRYGGVRQSTSDKRYYVADIDDFKVGFVNYVYQDSEDPTSYVSLNGCQLTDGDDQLVNTFSTENLDAFYSEMKQNISDMQSDGAEFIVADLHWGTEYELTESSTQDEMARQLADLGVDAILGGHPHVEEPVDVIEAADGSYTYVIYSQGNTLSNQRKELISSMPDGHTEDGVMITLTLKKDENDTVYLAGVDMLPTWCCLYTDEDKKSHYYILPLDDIENIEDHTGLTGIKEEAQASYDRTTALLGPGMEKAQEIFKTK